jgi:3-phenylpropionate/cinnamic acid dioxygenase small subunit
LHYEVGHFYYDRAALLDVHQYPVWLALFSDDALYSMPIRRTRVPRERVTEFAQLGEMTRA